MKHFLYYLILGSNLDDRIGQIILAKRYITEKAGEIVKESSCYETQPWGHEDQPWFINQAIEVNSPLEPAELLYTLKKIETMVGRKPHEKWHERHIDIDIILNDDTIIDEETLVIPHPLFHLRNFVLIPLMEIVPYMIHPILGKTIEELYLDCRDTGEVSIFNADEQGHSV